MPTRSLSGAPIRHEPTALWTTMQRNLAVHLPNISSLPARMSLQTANGWLPGRVLRAWSAVWIIVVCAEGFGPAVQAVDAFPDFEGLADHDHFLLQVTFRWTDQAQPPTRPLRVDRQAMRTPEGKRIIKHIFDSAPRVPWEFDVDTHLAQLNQHLGRALRQAFPLEAARPRSYIIQEYTWLHIRHRRELRRTPVSLQTGHAGSSP